eukprot:3678234-Alexandrium_andersonii.AAC.1
MAFGSTRSLRSPEPCLQRARLLHLPLATCPRPPASGLQPLALWPLAAGSRSRTIGPCPKLLL